MVLGGPLLGALATVDVSRDEPNTGAELSQGSLVLPTSRSYTGVSVSCEARLVYFSLMCTALLLFVGFVTAGSSTGRRADNPEQRAYYVHMSTSNDASIEFFFDAGAIHFKSMMSLVAIGSDRGWSSMMLHSGCFLGSFIYASSRTQIVQNEDQENIKHMNVLTAFTIVPALHDLFFIMCAVDDRIFQMKIAMTIAALGAIMKVKPFYNLNHIAVHLLVVMQTWIIANAIVTK